MAVVWVMVGGVFEQTTSTTVGLTDPWLANNISTPTTGLMPPPWTNVTPTGGNYSPWATTLLVSATTRIYSVNESIMGQPIPTPFYPAAPALHGLSEVERAAQAEDARRRRAHTVTDEETLLDQQRREAHSQVSHVRARELLLRFLTVEERAELEMSGRFTVRVRSGRRYTIAADHYHHNIHEIDEAGRRLAELCVAPENCREIPTPDSILAQLLWLRADEETLRRRANIRQIRARESGLL